MIEERTNESMKSILVGIEMGPMDKTLYDYVAKLANRTNPDFVSFLHVMPKLWNLKKGWDIHHPESISIQREIEASLFDEIRSSINESGLKMPKENIHIQIKMGDPLTQLLKHAKDIKPQLVVIGQKKASHDRGILSKNILQEVVQNALVIPEGFEGEINKILIPMDFSNYAKAAFNRALLLRKSIQKDVKITLLNIFEAPKLHKGLHNTMEQFMQLQKEEVESNFKLLIDSYESDEIKNVSTRFLPTQYNSIGYNLSKFANLEDFNFIIMGAKGQSPVNRLLMGSVTERVLTNEMVCPVMIVKN